MTLRRWHLAAAIGLVAVAFVGGRISAPTPAPVEIEGKERIVYRDRDVVRIVTVREEAKQERRNLERVKVTQPDGTVFERERDMGSTLTLTHQALERVDLHERAGAVEREIAVGPALPQWRAGLTLDAAPRLVPPRLANPVVGVALERRLAGRLWVGLRLTSAKRVGASASWEW